MAPRANLVAGVRGVRMFFAFPHGQGAHTCEIGIWLTSVEQVHNVICAVRRRVIGQVETGALVLPPGSRKPEDPDRQVRTRPALERAVVPAEPELFTGVQADRRRHLGVCLQPGVLGLARRQPRSLVPGAYWDER